MSKEHKFVGFDAYQKAMDCLRPGDVVIFATPPAFRWVHFTYAIQKTMTSAAPLVMDKLTKRYPFPQPGIVRDREYLA